ncbi:MAG: 16S rRNA (guanine(966)-N(2))-methyltransferase RsmD [Chloroflexi bacterium]|nr:16S rRNA (guanine(966)-N(2))-methyltransferase RsmD [Chloroflexota bacterium]
MSQPRIIAGMAKGTRLKVVPGNITRPITDKVKGALFNILSNDIEGCIFLDLFGGTGSVGLEALSRGAEFAVFIEKNRAACTILKENITSTRFGESADVFLMDALKYLQKEPDRLFDYIFVAPPQFKALWKKTIYRLEENPQWLDPDGKLIVQIDVLEYEKMDLSHFTEVEQRKYGDTLLLFYERK